MVFSSLNFIFLFLPLALALYYLARGRWLRNFVLFLTSLFFYAWGEPVYVLLMVLSVTVNYLVGRGIGYLRAREREGRARLLFWLSVAFNLGLLGVFKYSGFLVGTVNGLFGLALPVPQLTLPIGISFYTFQIMTYVIDVYRREVEVQKSYVALGAYIAMYPQLIAGPIVRYGDIAAQLKDRRETLEGFASGVRVFTMGLSKKVLIANLCGRIADGVLGTSEFGTAAAWLGVLAYAFQIYFDFSGYSTMAIGLGEMMGFRMPENFRYPYISRSVTEFWRRWHITLSTFFRDYLYIPLGGNRVSEARWYLNIFIVWFATGLWHGASWNFVLWGLYYGALLVLEKKLLSKWFSKLPAAVGWAYTALATLFGWVIFYQTDFAGIGRTFAALFGFGGTETALSLGVLPYLPILIPAALFATPLPKRLYDRARGSMAGVVLCDLLLAGLFVLSVASLTSDTFNPFIYFRF